MSGEMLTVPWMAFLESPKNKWSRRAVVVFVQYRCFKSFADAIKSSEGEERSSQ